MASILNVINLPLQDQLKVSKAAVERVRTYFGLPAQQAAFKDFYTTEN